ncbi:MAG TPA: hypothetical protein VGO25_07165 [Rhodanobacteraceae bacterium]|jgi:hypothetical protein|nr:hypothetical protein [Rhodanobacteraceae bacterium]
MIDSTLVLISLQALVVAFLALHDWIPLGSLNDLDAVQAADSRAKLVRTTLLSTVPYAIGFVASVLYARTGFPSWLRWWLWISYGALVYGMVRAWWLPYFFVNDRVRAERYRRMFEHTHSFMPERNGIRPNTLHVIFHVAVLAVVALLISAL